MLCWSSPSVVSGPFYWAVEGETVPKKNRKIAAWTEKSEHCISCLFPGAHSRESKLNDSIQNTTLLPFYDQFFQSSASIVGGSRSLKES